jgi:hypothetical protein
MEGNLDRKVILRREDDLRQIEVYQALSLSTWS